MREIERMRNGGFAYGKTEKSIVLMARVLVLALLIGVFASVPSEQTFAAANKALRSKVVFNGDKESDAAWMNNNYVMQAGYKKSFKNKEKYENVCKAYVPAAALKRMEIPYMWMRG